MDVVIDHVTVPLMVVRKTKASHAVVLSNGAVDQEVAHHEPVFQRSSWYQDIDHHQVYVYDPATGAPDYLSLAWGHLTSDHWVVPEVGQAVRAVMDTFGVRDPASRMYFGSSAGGFYSLALLADDPGALAVINNAQFDWTRWMPTGVNALRHARFGGMLPAAIRTSHPLTSNVLMLLKKRDVPVRIRYHVNVTSDHDRKQDLPLFRAFMSNAAHLCDEVSVHPYAHHTHGHNPMSRPATLRVINKAFDADPPMHDDAPDTELDEGRSWPVHFLGSDAATTEILGDGRHLVRYDVLPREDTHHPIRGVLSEKPGADTLVVCFHSLVDRSRHPLPRFERFAELSGLPHHMLFLSDPTLESSDTLRSGWYVGTAEDPLPDRLADHIGEAAKALGVGERVLLVGSCGGGFAAMALAPRLTGSLALAFSPDTTLDLVAEGGPATALARTAFPETPTWSALHRGRPTLVDLNALYQHTVTGHVWYVQNSGDAQYVAEAMEPFQEHADERVQVVTEHHCTGHNPPTPARIRSWINYACEDFEADPRQFGLAIRPRSVR
ncbi:hypothetical protein [Kocuria tytonis]|uniref:Alpha/beta hydrolase n=1 Tax=Kocuria tytonis TaxID=2054280 RepID=A0A495A9G1_9MICC|nr:hypothetical protein [Kocuria tytonis]RKQ36413.1 hypothetical protein C1C97_001690 [Kocuria tytonis]